MVTARDKASPQSADALEKLCRTYWYPLYAYVRRLGHSPPDAEDLTQEFFGRLLAKNYLEAADREKGRFRTFLLVALKRFLANEWDRARTQKRGGGQMPLPLDTALAEHKYESEAVLPDVSADLIFERRWALTLLDQTMARLRAEFEQAGKSSEFARLKGFLTLDRNEAPYAQVAVEMGSTEGAVRVAVHRLRKRFRELFREEIAHTVARGEEIEEELRHLLSVLS